MSKKRFVNIEGKNFNVTLEPLPDGEFEVSVDDGARRSTFRCSRSRRIAVIGGHVLAAEGNGAVESIVSQGRRVRLSVSDRPTPASNLGQATSARHHGELRAPLPGQVVAVLVAEGDHVEPGQRLVVIEAMKMQNPLQAERAARVARVHVAVHDSVQTGQLLLELGNA